MTSEGTEAVVRVEVGLVVRVVATVVETEAVGRVAAATVAWKVEGRGVAILIHRLPKSEFSMEEV